MHRFPKRALAAVAIAVMSSAVGCGHISWSFLPWAQQDDQAPFTTPAQRVDELRELAESMPTRTPAEQQRLAEELSAEFRDTDDVLLRAEIVRTLARADAPVAGTTLWTALADDEQDVQLAACDAWAKRGGPEAIQALGGVMQRSDDIQVRLAAARGLGEAKDPAAVSLLAVALEDPDPALQRRAVESLRAITGQDYGNDVNLWRQFAHGEAPEPPTPSIVRRLLPFF